MAERNPSASTAMLIGALFGILEGISVIIVLVLYILHVQDTFPRDLNLGLFEWGVFLLTAILILYNYQRALRRLGISRSWKLVALAGGTTGLCTTLIVACSHAVINLNSHSLYQAIVALDEGPYKVTQFTLANLPLFLVGSILLHAVYFVVATTLSPGNTA